MIKRVLKFRVWDKEEKKMFFLDKMLDTELLEVIYVSDVIRGKGDIVVMQFIGIEDSSGKEIYEGDIVKVDDRQIGAKEVHIGEVYYCTDYTLGIYPGFAGWSKKGHFELSPNTKVIGNIYENPELRKGGTINANNQI